jgi:hypothetical protein
MENKNERKKRATCRHSTTTPNARVLPEDANFWPTCSRPAYTELELSLALKVSTLVPSSLSRMVFSKPTRTMISVGTMFCN